MSRAWAVGALLFSALMRLTSQGLAAEGPTFEANDEQIVAYSLDRYAVRSRVSDAEPRRARFVIRRLGTDEPLEQVECAVAGPCELTAVLGMRGCSYSNIVPGTTLYGLRLERPAAPAGPRWILSIEVASGREAARGRVPVVALNGGDLALKAAVRAGARVVAILSEASSSSGTGRRDYAVVLNDADLENARRYGPEQATVHAPPLVALDEAEGEPLPPRRTARPFRAMPVRTVVDAARSAAAFGMGSLAACWITQNASVMSPRQLPALARALARDPVLAPLVPSVHRSRHRGHGPQRRAPS